MELPAFHHGIQAQIPAQVLDKIAYLYAHVPLFPQGFDSANLPCPCFKNEHLIRLHSDS